MTGMPCESTSDLVQAPTYENLPLNRVKVTTETGGSFNHRASLDGDDDLRAYYCTSADLSSCVIAGGSADHGRAGNTYTVEVDLDDRPECSGIPGGPDDDQVSTCGLRTAIRDEDGIWHCSTLTPFRYDDPEDPDGFFLLRFFRRVKRFIWSIFRS